MNNLNLIDNDEVFKPVIVNGVEYSNYLVSNYGRLYSVKFNKLLCGFLNYQGYVDYDLYKDGKRKHFKAHRLVALHYVKNPDALNIVNHKDEIRNNNHVSNLEWCTQSYNLRYGDAQKRRIEKVSKPVIQVDTDLNIVNEYPSLIETSRQTGIPLTNLFKACTYGVKQRDYYWAYIGKGEEYAS